MAYPYEMRRPDPLPSINTVRAAWGARSPIVATVDAAVDWLRDVTRRATRYVVNAFQAHPLVELRLPIRERRLLAMAQPTPPTRGAGEPPPPLRPSPSAPLVSESYTWSNATLHLALGAAACNSSTLPHTSASGGADPPFSDPSAPKF